MTFQMRGSPTGAHITGWPGKEDWHFHVAINRHGQARVSHQRPKKRRGQLTDDEKQRIAATALALCGFGVSTPDDPDAAAARVKAFVRHRIPIPTGNLAVDFVAASRPYPRGSHNTRERAETIAMVYGTALGQGLCPYKVLSKVYGHPIDTSGTIDKYSTTVDRWVRQEARKEGFLTLDREESRPQRWPRSRRHELEGRRSPVMKPEPRQCTCGKHDRE